MLPRIARASWGAGSTRLIVHQADETLIGETGFHGPPDASGTVEVGYSIVPAYRGLGFDVEATRALIRDSLAHLGILRITAERRSVPAPGLTPGGHGTPGTVQALENSEVSPVLWSVAVAVTTCPVGTFFLVWKVKVASPLELVVTLFWPRNFLPSPLPDGSATGLPKNWTL